MRFSSYIRKLCVRIDTDDCMPPAVLAQKFRVPYRQPAASFHSAFASDRSVSVVGRCNAEGAVPDSWSGTAPFRGAWCCYLMVIVLLAMVRLSEPVATMASAPVGVPAGMITVILALPLTSVRTEVVAEP